jgi:hypothetical protein
MEEIEPEALLNIYEDVNKLVLSRTVTETSLNLPKEREHIIANNEPDS